MQDTPASHESPVHAHESSDLSIRAIIWFAVGLIVAGVVVHFTLGGLWSVLLERREPAARLSPYASPKQLPPAPRLQTNPPADLKAFRDSERRQMETYGWVNRPAGVVRIPIERAMDLVLQRGLPRAASGNLQQGDQRR
jgi:hypothetical protein